MTEGLSHTTRITVAESDTAIAHGSGDMPVLATPRMLALMENAAMLAVAPCLPAGSTTVGGRIESTHLKPSPVGVAVEATAVLDRVDGRKLHFKVTARQADGTVIGEGTHLRVVVDRDHFVAGIAGGSR